MNDLQDAMTVVDEWRVTFPVLYDSSTEVAQSYGIYDLLDDGLAAPSMFIIDADGVIRWKYIGTAAGDRPTLATIKEQLSRLTTIEMVPSPQSEATPEPEVQVGTDIGDTAPGFTLPSTAGIDRTLESYRGDKNVVVVFYRAFW